MVAALVKETDFAPIAAAAVTTQFIKVASKKYIASGIKNAEAVAKAHSEFVAQEIDMKKQAADKPVESVDGSTLPEGTKKFDAKPAAIYRNFIFFVFSLRNRFKDLFP